MKIDTLVLENFGIYGMKQFPLAAESLILIYGPNEAGKTTALNGLRQALFGFPGKNPYLTGKTMSASVQATLRDGQRIEFSRRKKQVDNFAGKRNRQTPLTQDELTHILGNFDLKAYESLFGFSLDELRKGNEALKHTKLTEALAGGGLGGLDRLIRVQKDIQSFLGETLKKSGGSARINAKLSEIRSESDTLESLEISPAELDLLHQRLANATQRSQSCSVQLDRLRAELADGQRLAGALPMLAELSSIERLISDCKIPPAIDAEFCAQWTILSDTRVKLSSRLACEKRELVEIRTDLSHPLESSKWLEWENELETIGYQAGEIGALRQTELNWQRDEVEATEELSRSLREMNADDLPADLLDHELESSQREELEDLLVEFEQSTRQQNDLRLRQEATQQLRLRIAGCPEDALVPEHLDELEMLTGELEVAEKELRRLHEGERTAEMQAALNALADRLASQVGQGQLSVQWELMPDDEIQRHAGRLSELDRELQKLRHEVDRIDIELVRRRDEVRELRGKSGASSLDELRSVWMRRDVRLSSWLDELTRPLLANSISLGEQMTRVSELQELAAQNDQVVGRLLESADLVATINEQERLVKQLQNDHARATTSLEKLRRRRAEFIGMWDCRWAGSVAQPMEPAAMLRWCGEFRAWQSQQVNIAADCQAATERKSSIGEFLSRLKALWPTPIFPTEYTPALRRQVHQWRAMAVDRQQRSSQLEKLAEEIHRLQQEQKRLDEELTRCRERFDIWLAAQPYPRHWSLDRFRALLACLTKCRKSHQRLARAKQQRCLANEKIREFEANVNALAKQLQIALESSATAENHADRWLRCLRAARQEHSRRAQLNVSHSSRISQSESLEKELCEIDKAIGAMIAICGAAEPAKATQWVEKAEQIDELLHRKQQLEIGLQALSLVQVPESTNGLVARRDSASLELHRTALEQSIRELEQQRNFAEQEIGALDSELRLRQNSVDALHHAHQLRRLRSELGELSEQWIVHKLADQLLLRTIERFSRDHEPELMRHVRRHLAKLTGGRYTRVEQVSGKDQGLIVRDVDGVATEPDKLSTGTREQLYLAIRMAFIDHYCAHYEPLPVMMDDCFVNFDDVRARYAVEALLNWDAEIQTILLSCHGRMLHILAELAPGTTVISLEHDQITTAKALAENEMLML